MEIVNHCDTRGAVVYDFDNDMFIVPAIAGNSRLLAHRLFLNRPHRCLTTAAKGELESYIGTWAHRRGAAARRRVDH